MEHYITLHYITLHYITTHRGVQYVHCVMHKCILVKLGGNENDRKYVKKRKFYEIIGEICKSREGKEKFPKTGGKCTETAYKGGNAKFIKVIRNLDG